MSEPAATTTPASGSTDRRAVVLSAALRAFLRHGYRKTSMEDVATAARISRPGLYFLFESKQKLFAAAMQAAVERDLGAAARALQDQTRPLQERLLAAFDAWTGRYLGAVGGELSAVAESHADLLDAVVLQAPHRFQDLIVDAVVRARAPQDRATSEAIARTLLSTALGLKHQSNSRETFRAGLDTAIALLLR